MEDLRKKDIRYHSTITELEDKQRKTQDEMRKEFEGFEKNLKSIQLGMITLGSSETRLKTPKDSSEESKKGGSGSIPAEGREEGVNFKNQLNDRLNKLQNSLQGFVSESEFNRFKGETRAKLEESERRHDKLVNEY